ncbi:hypothetical protein F7R02_22595 [Xanthomonas cissicola]|nr:hypothetical protein F7R02_22595 [Xanthomonas cissicola]
MNRTLSVRRGRGALTACGTRRESSRGGSAAASMPPHGPAGGEHTAPARACVAFVKDRRAMWTATVAEKSPTARRRSGALQPIHRLSNRFQRRHRSRSGSHRVRQSTRLTA